MNSFPEEKDEGWEDVKMDRGHSAMETEKGEDRKQGGGENHHLSMDSDS